MQHIGYCLTLLLLVCAAVCIGWKVQFSYVGCNRDYAGSVRDIDGLIGVTRYGKYSKIASDPNVLAPLTWKLGSEICAIGGFAYMGLQSGIGCYCGNSYGSQGATGGCTAACAGNSSQRCGASNKNSVFRLAYTEDFKPPSRFTKTSRSRSSIEPASAAAKLTGPPLHRTAAARSRIECARLCRMGCQAVLFNSQQRLCHLLRLTVIAGDLLTAEGDFYIRK